MRAGGKLQTALRLIYPSRCLTCSTMVESDFGLCGPCWRDTPFIGGLVCDCCGTPLPGEDLGEVEICDDCMTIARPWARGRAALLYKDNGRKLVLALKHGDHHEIARPAAKWMVRAAAPLLKPNMLVAPVPLHWTRMLKRRFNQSALLAEQVAREADLAYCPELLVRARRTKSLGGLSWEERFAEVSETIKIHPKRAHRIAGRPVLIVDDVMTSGATLAATVEACKAARAAEVSILTLARVAKDA